MACVQGTWWGVGGGVVGGWWGPGFCGGFLGGVGFWGWGVWWVGVCGWRVLVLGWCGVCGFVPLRPLLNSPPRPLGVLWVLVRVVPLLGGGCCLLVAVLWGAVLFWGGGLVLWVACLAGCVLAGLFSTWGRGCCFRWLFRFGRVVAGGVPWLLALWVVSVSGGWSLAGCVVPVGWADLDGRALRRPPLSPPRVRDGGFYLPGSGGGTHTLKR